MQCEPYMALVHTLPRYHFQPYTEMSDQNNIPVGRRPVHCVITHPLYMGFRIRATQPITLMEATEGPAVINKLRSADWMSPRPCTLLYRITGRLGVVVWSGIDLHTILT